MLPDAEPLPHVNCSLGLGTSGGKDGVAEHGDAEGTDGGGSRALSDVGSREEGADIGRVRRHHRIPSQARDATASRSGRRTPRSAGATSSLFRGGTQRARASLGGVRPDLREAAEGVDACLIEAMERHGHLDLAPEIRDKLLAMSAATIDRALARGAIRVRSQAPAACDARLASQDFNTDVGRLERSGAGFCRSGPRSAQRSIGARQLHPDPRAHRRRDRLDRVRSIDCARTDAAEHCADGIAQTIALRAARPRYGQRHRVYERDAEGLLRCGQHRPHALPALPQEHDQAFVEQKNGAVVRRMVGYRRFEGLEAATLLAQLYRSARLFANFFQPSFKLIAKQRDGARVRKTYSAPATPHQRLAADARTPEAVRAHLQEIYAALDPVALLHDIRAAQERLAALADVQPIVDPAMASQPIDLFLASLRTAWKDGGVRPTDRPIVKAKRGRRRPDPLIRVTPDLRKWFEAKPWRTGSELLSRLQVEYPGAYSNFERFSAA